jgi:hypothetical protein
VPTPQFGEEAVAEPVSGRVRVRVPGSNRFVELDGSEAIPFGATIDTKSGAVELTSLASAGGAPQRARFSEGMFKLGQSGNVTVLSLNEPLTGCRPSRSARSAARKTKSRRLWGDGKGRFRISGRYSAATVRGTKWMVQDTCTATLVRVTQGSVSVRDSVRKRTVVVRAGKRYTAKARR